MYAYLSVFICLYIFFKINVHSAHNHNQFIRYLDFFTQLMLLHFLFTCFYGVYTTHNFLLLNKEKIDDGKNK